MGVLDLSPGIAGLNRRQAITLDGLVFAIYGGRWCEVISEKCIILNKKYVFVLGIWPKNVERKRLWCVLAII